MLYYGGVAASKCGVSEARLIDMKRLSWSKIELSEELPNDSHSCVYHKMKFQAGFFYVYGGSNEPKQGSVIYKMKLVQNKKLKIEKIELSENCPLHRKSHTMHVIDQGDDNPFLLMIGGITNKGQICKDVWKFELVSKKWSKVSDLPSGRYNHVSEYDKKRNRVVIFGGNDEKSDKTNTVLEVDIKNAFQTKEIKCNVEKGRSPPQRELTSSKIINDCLVLFGGNAVSGPLADCWGLNLETNTWHFLSKKLGPERFGHSLFYYNNLLFSYGGKLKTGRLSGDFLKIKINNLMKKHIKNLVIDEIPKSQLNAMPKTQIINKKKIHARTVSQVVRGQNAQRPGQQRARVRGRDRPRVKVDTPSTTEPEEKKEEKASTPGTTRARVRGRDRVRVRGRGRQGESIDEIKKRREEERLRKKKEREELRKQLEEERKRNRELQNKRKAERAKKRQTLKKKLDMNEIFQEGGNDAKSDRVARAARVRLKVRGRDRNRVKVSTLKKALDRTSKIMGNREEIDAVIPKEEVKSTETTETNRVALKPRGRQQRKRVAPKSLKNVRRAPKKTQVKAPNGKSSCIKQSKKPIGGQKIIQFGKPKKKEGICFKTDLEVKPGKIVRSLYVSPKTKKNAFIDFVSKQFDTYKEPKRLAMSKIKKKTTEEKDELEKIKNRKPRPFLLTEYVKNKQESKEPEKNVKISTRSGVEREEIGESEEASSFLNRNETNAWMDIIKDMKEIEKSDAAENHFITFAEPFCAGQMNWVFHHEKKKDRVLPNLYKQYLRNEETDWRFLKAVDESIGCTFIHKQKQDDMEKTQPKAKEYKPKKMIGIMGRKVMFHLEDDHVEQKLMQRTETKQNLKYNSRPKRVKKRKRRGKDPQAFRVLPDPKTHSFKV